MQNENTQEKIKSNPIDLLSIAVSCSIICDSETHLNTVSRCALQEYFRSLVEGILQSAGTPHYLILALEPNSEKKLKGETDDDYTKINLRKIKNRK